MEIQNKQDSPEIAEAFVWTGIVSGSIMVLLYAAVLIRTLKGSKYRQVILNVSCLLAANGALIVFAVSYRYLVITHKNPVEPDSLAMVWIFSVSNGVYDLLFCIVHWVLASSYRSISKEMPRIVQGSDVDHAARRRERIVFWVMMAANILFPVVEVVGFQGWNFQFFVELKQEPDAYWLDISAVGQNAMWICQIISGFTLVQAIYRIRRFMSEQDDNSVDTKMMTLHASAFGLYLISVVGLIIVNTLQLFDLDLKLTLFGVVIIAATVFLCLSFIAQVLLCAIFWDLGRKKEKQEESEEEEFAEVTLEDWDEDAELQMRIWNSFLREQKQVSSLISDGSNSLVLST